jgi:hypothetical protein
LCVVCSAGGDDLYNNLRHSSCKLYEQWKATEGSTFRKRKTGPPRELLRTARSYCGQRAVTADRSNGQMSRKYVFASRKTVTQNQDPSFAMGLADLAVVSCTVTRDQYSAVCLVTVFLEQTLQSPLINVKYKRCILEPRQTK